MVSFMGTKKIVKSAIKSSNNLTYLHSDSFEINTCKLQGNESFLVAQVREKVSYRFLQKIYHTDSNRIYHVEWRYVNTILNYTTLKYATQKYNTHVQR